MDYRLVKQFSNNAVDSFFNFFYKIADFGKVIIDLFWAFVDIWYQFFMVFINAWLYIYYFVLFILDKLTMTQFFTQGGKARHAMPGTKAYRPDVYVPINPMFGKVDIIKPAETVAAAVTAAAKAPAKAVKNAAKKNIIRDTSESVVLFFSRIGRALTGFFKNIGEFASNKLRPVREEMPEKNKSLIDEYMKEYERKKKA